jgi:hypothetical protein
MNLINRPAGLLVPFESPDAGKERLSKKWLFGILFFALLIRIYVAFFASLPHVYADSVGYFQQADTLLAGGYTNYFPNGYPLIIALMKALAGSQARVLLLCVNILFSTGSVYFLYRLAKKVFRWEGAALTAAFLLAVWPSQVNYVRWYTSEVPTVFFLLAALLFYYDKRHWLSGLFFGLVGVIRTDVLAVLFVLMALEVWWKKGFNWRLLAGTLLPLLLIGSYCYLKTGSFSISGHAKANILYAVTASGNDIDWQYMNEHPEVHSTGQAIGMYFDFFKTQPLQFVKNKLANLWELWGFFPSSAHGTRGLLSRLVIGLSNLFLVGFGLFAWWKQRKDFNVFLLGIPFFILTPIHAMLIGIPRYTYPAEPFMILLAAWTLSLLLPFRTAQAGLRR